MMDLPDHAPPEIKLAAALVQRWLASQQPPANPRRNMSAAEMLDYCRQFRQDQMPAWRDPRIKQGG